jgi:hypothetical protein
MLLAVVIGLLVIFTRIGDHGPASSGTGILVAAVAGGLGTGGVRLLVWPVGRRRR